MRSPSVRPSQQGWVSIPSSSGHQFTACRRLRACASSPNSFNPFFIRASVYWVLRTRSSMSSLSLFQSLLHQGISLLFLDKSQCDPYLRRFNPFFIRASVYWNAEPPIMRAPSLMFQSLLHQGISLLEVVEAHPLHAGRFGFQSLLHQGISLLKAF